MLVVIPTAIPVDPLTNRLGNLLGRTTGSFVVSSKFGLKSTVSLSISLRSSEAILLILASVYLIAAAVSPSIDPKLPCPSTRRYLVEKSCASLTIELYTD